jgi:hypothetical protein
MEDAVSAVSAKTKLRVKGHKGQQKKVSAGAHRKPKNTERHTGVTTSHNGHTE